MPPQKIPQNVFARIKQTLLQRAAVWGEGYRIRTILKRRGEVTVADWMEKHYDVIAHGWKDGMTDGTDLMTGENIRLTITDSGPIIPDPDFVDKLPPPVYDEKPKERSESKKWF